jgi:hypothetical protein
MPLNDVIFVKGKGGLGRPALGEDFISALVFYTNTLPSGFTSNARIKLVDSVQTAVSLGIDDTYADETKAAATYLFTNAGATGDTVQITVQEYISANNPTGLVNLGTYTRLSTDTTVTLLGASVAAFINAGTLTHGYTATASTGTVTITARPSLGVFLNTGTPFVVTIVGTIAGTLTQPTGSGSTVLGVASLKATWYYHISEFYRINPTGSLYVGMYAVPATYDFAEIALMQSFASGKIRNWAAFADGTTYTRGKVQAAQAAMATIEASHMPASMLLTFNYAAATLSALADLATLNSNKVSLVISQDGFAQGYELYKGSGKSVTNIGAILGAVSLAKVSEDIAWIAKFNISNGIENDTAAFANGDLFSSVSTSLLNTLNNYRYIFNTKQVGYAGTFINDSHTCITFTSDYAYIENNRTIDKAIRNLRAAYLPYIASPILLNADGTITDSDLANLTSVGETSLDQMVRDGELSAKQVIISSTQNIATTSTLTIAVELVSVAIARNIVINIKYVLALS